MKPFNLELAKKGHPVRTRDGRKARIICFDKKDNDCPICALIDNGENEYVFLYSNDGCVFGGDQSGEDLMMASEKKEGWINIYKRDDGVSYTGGTIHKTEELARKFVPDDLVDTIKIEWEE